MNLKNREKREIEAFDGELLNIEIEDDKLLLSDVEIARYRVPYEQKRYPIDLLFKTLGDPNGLRLLDIGCGHGVWSTILGVLGARVTGIDLSLLHLDLARRRTEINCIHDRVEFLQASVHDLPFPADTFDIVFGNAILHHLDVRPAGPEVLRVLKKGGRAVFREPVALSAALRRFRETTLIKALVKEARTSPDEAPLTPQSVDTFGAGFSDTQIHEAQLVSRLQRVFGGGKPYKVMNDFDIRLFQLFPHLKRYAREAILELRK